MPKRTILITGFEPYGGRTDNPAHRAAVALDGRTIEGYAVVGRSLPVSFARMRPALAALMQEVEPAAAIGLGLYPGETALRLERIGVNIADFEIPDNDGLCLRDQPVSEGCVEARAATLPLRAIEEALLDAGIPSHLSATAGTYLCNACLYALIEMAAAPTLAGFIHVPYMPEQVADLSRAGMKEAREPPPSMDLALVIAGIEIAIRETVRAIVNR